MVYSKSSFLTGFVSGFSHSLSKQQKKIIENISINNKLPITINDPLLEERYKKEYLPKFD
jgi:hypothetical protein